MIGWRERLAKELEEIKPECSPLCRVVSHEDTNQAKIEHAPGCPVWHRGCAMNEERE